MGKHRFILVADDRAIIEFDSASPYTVENARKLSEEVSMLMKTKSNIILSPDFEFIDKRPGYLRIEERLEALERLLPNIASTKSVAMGKRVAMGSGRVINAKPIKPLQALKRILDEGEAAAEIYSGRQGE